MPYVIRNCPACRQYQVGIYTCDDLYDCDLQRCQNSTDCVLKRIVELCKATSEFCRECSKEAIYQVDCIECTKGGKAELGTDILKLLDIQEVE